MDNNTPHAAKDWYDFLPPACYSTNYVTWHFSLDEPDGERRLRECLDAPKVMAAVREFERFLSEVIGVTEKQDTRMCFESARGELFAIFNRRGLSPWDE